jgi:hypothetical protein
MNEKELRKIIRELAEAELKEFDVLVKKRAKDKMISKEKDWKEEKQELKSNMSSLLKHISSDKYEECSEKIDDVISQLKDWKKKINKFL